MFTNVASVTVETRIGFLVGVLARRTADTAGFQRLPLRILHENSSVGARSGFAAAEWTVGADFTAIRRTDSLVSVCGGTVVPSRAQFFFSLFVVAVVSAFAVAFFRTAGRTPVPVSARNSRYSP